MGVEINPEKIKRKVYMSYFQDGLWDIVLGLVLLGWGGTIIFDLPWLPGAAFVAFFWLALGLKQKITYPRIGYSRPAEQRRRLVRLAIAGAVVLVFVLVALPLVTSGAMLQFLRDYIEFALGIMFALAAGLIGMWWGIVRWYLYAAVIFLCAAATQWLGLSFALEFLIPGLIICISGLIVFIRFIRKYPGREVPEDTR